MKNIKELTNLESGKCVLIGGGPFVSRFDFSKVRSEVSRLAVNRCFVDSRIDYQIFADSFFSEWIRDHPIQDARILIGNKERKDGRMDYYFDFMDSVSEGFHTGYHALQIAELLGFDEVYLVGFDYYEEDGKIHYYEGEHGTEITDAEKAGMRKLLDKWVVDFDKHKWKAMIYNCNPKSKLKKFPYKEVNDEF